MYPAPCLRIKTLQHPGYFSVILPLSFLRCNQHSKFDVYLPTYFFILLLNMFVPINIWYSFKRFFLTLDECVIEQIIFQIANCIHLTLPLRFIIYSLCIVFHLYNCVQYFIFNTGSHLFIHSCSFIPADE